MTELNIEIEGLADLTKQMDRLGAEVAAKKIRSAMMAATLPTVRKMQAAAPVGKSLHKTYKGRVVFPGFLKKSVRRSAKIEKGRVNLRIGVRREAFYGITFIDQGTKGIPAQNWFEANFRRDAPTIVSKFRATLASRVKKSI